MDRATSIKTMKPMVLGFFFLSGMTGLTYEILWTRLLVKIVGGAPFTISIVLTVFMAGLGLGSYLAGKVIDRILSPLRLITWYGLLELIIGTFALLIPIMLIAFKPVYAYLYDHLFNSFLLFNFLTFIGCVLVLAVPVIGMGATLPILCRFYVTGLSTLGTHAGRLYGLNTIGAALGSLVCGFWLLEMVGNMGTLVLAAAVNYLIGIVCLLVSRKADRHAGPQEWVEFVADSTSQTSSDTGRPLVTGALVIFAVSGFCSMACEVIWTKMLAMIVGPTTYSFTVVLVTFISGLALGSMMFGWLADRIGKTVQLLVATQTTAAFLILLVTHLLGNSQLFFAKLIAVYQNDFTVLSITKAVALFTLMLLPTLCLGATFPLVGKIFTKSFSVIGRSIGSAYAINTVGAVLGAFCAGFILIPFVGKETAVKLIVGLQLLTSSIVGIIFVRHSDGSGLKWVLAVMPLVVGLTMVTIYPSWNRPLLAKGVYHRSPQLGLELRNYGWMQTLINGPEILSRFEKPELIYYGDGAGGTIAVMKESDAIGNDTYAMLASGKVDASSYGDMFTQVLMGHFPMMFHPSARDVMVLGLASGVTAGEVLHYPIDRLDILEISNEVVDACRHFTPWNNNVLSDPRSNLIVQDGRAHLELTRRRYDVIISEPSNPWMVGQATLFTKEFFSLAHEALRRDGIFVQWVHSYQMDWRSFSLVGRTFASVFPNSILVNTSPSAAGFDYLLIGFKSDEGLNIESALGNRQHMQKSTNLALNDPRLLYRQIVSEDLMYLFGEGALNTDDTPILEFAAPRVMYIEDPLIPENIQRRMRLGTETDSLVHWVIADIDAQINLVRYALSLYAPFPSMIDLANAGSEQQEEYLALMKSYSAKHLMDFSIIENAHLRNMLRIVQGESILGNLDKIANRSAAYYQLSRLCFDQSEYENAVREGEARDRENGTHVQLELSDRLDLEDAEKYLNHAIHLNPDMVEAYVNLSVIYVQQSKFEEAKALLETAISIRPYYAEALYNYGKVLSRLNQESEAIHQFSAAAQANPRLSRAHYDLGVLYAKNGKLDSARASLGDALANSPDFAEAHCRLALVLVRLGRLDEAIYHFEETLRLNPSFAPAREGLREARIMMERQVLPTTESDL